MQPLPTQRRRRETAKRFETRSGYIRAIEEVLRYHWSPGPGDADDQWPEFPYEYSNNLQVMPGVRLDAVLAMVEKAVGGIKDAGQVTCGND